VEALGGAYPVTGHLAMILGTDRKRLSKRHGAASVEEFRDAGYLPEAVVNYLALLGWSYDETTELMTREQLVERFSIDRVNPAPAVFDHQKLQWMNGVYLRGLDAGEYGNRLRAYLQERGSPLAECQGLEAAAPLVQEKIGALGEFEDFAGFLFRPVVYEPDAWKRLAAVPEAAAVLAGAAEALEAIDGDLTSDAVEASLRTLVEHLGLKPRTAFTPLRVAITGRTVSPGLFESIALLGRDESLSRIRAARAHLER
jgi:glutamyl/glutaminyl-tRNA synthetase